MQIKYPQQAISIHFLDSYLFLFFFFFFTLLGLCSCAGSSLAAVHGLRVAVAFPVAAHRL